MASGIVIQTMAYAYRDQISTMTKSTREADITKVLEVEDRAVRQSRAWVWFAAAGVIILLLFVGPSVAASTWNLWAAQAIADDQPDRALGWLKWSVWLNNRDGEAVFLTARAYRKKGQFDQVREQLLRAHKLNFDPRRLEKEQVLALAQNGQMMEAEPAFGELLRNPQGDEVEICEAFTHGFFLNRQYNEAFRLLESWIKDFPNSVKPYYMRGHIQSRLQHYPQAESDFRKVLSIDSNHPAAAFGLGEALRSQQMPEALQYYEMATNVPEYALLAGIGKTQCLKMLGRTDEAKVVARDLLNRFPDDAGPQREMGQLELETGNYAEALRYLDMAIVKLPNDRETRNARGSALRGLRRLDEARKEFELVNEARLALERAQMLSEKLEKEVDSPELRFEIGRIYLKYSEPREGVIWLQSVFNYEPRHRQAHLELARYYDQKSKNSPEFAKLARHHRQLAEPVSKSDETQQPEETPTAPQTSKVDAGAIRSP